MSAAVALESGLDREQAIGMLRGRGVRGWWRRQRRGRLIAVREVEIPYHLFEVRVSNGGRLQASWLAVDAVTGALDLYRFDAPPAGGGGGGRSRVPERLSGARQREILEERVRRQVYLSGFFRLRDLRIEVGEPALEVRIPYWVGIYRQQEVLSIDVIGGVRRQWEGAKLRDVILSFLSATEAGASAA